MTDCGRVRVKWRMLLLHHNYSPHLIGKVNSFFLSFFTLHKHIDKTSGEKILTSSPSAGCSFLRRFFSFDFSLALESETWPPTFLVGFGPLSLLQRSVHYFLWSFYRYPFRIWIFTITGSDVGIPPVEWISIVFTPGADIFWGRIFSKWKRNFALLFDESSF